jgi:hypothetical protein
MAILLNPVAARDLERHAPATRPSSLAGRRVALVWNGKQNGELALRCVADALASRAPGLTTDLIRIPYGIPEATLHEIRTGYDAAVAATGD